MTQIEKIAKVFGVGIGEKFKIRTSDDVKYEYDFCFDNVTGLTYDGDDSIVDDVLQMLLIGSCHIVRKQYKPSKGDDYYFINDQGEPIRTMWKGWDLDYYRYNAGNVFFSMDDIDDEAKVRVVNEMKHKYVTE